MVEMTIDVYKERSNRSKKLLLWFAMVSIIMVFAGLTSAYVVSKSRVDWKNFDMPISFFVSTILILFSSFTFHLAKRFTKQDNQKSAGLMLLITLLLGIFFVVFQFEGFKELIKVGLYATGPTSTVTTSFLYVVVVAHLAHLAGGLISLLVIIINNYRRKYNSKNTIGIELGAMFWHFLDFVWLYLFLFLYFIK